MDKPPKSPLDLLGVMRPAPDHTDWAVVYGIKSVADKLDMLLDALEQTNSRLARIEAELSLLKDEYYYNHRGDL